MIVAVSPYHLTTREPPAMAALLLASRVVTLRPEPAASGPVGAADAARRVPAFGRLVESWGWAADLWRAGVIAPGVAGQSAVEDVRAVCGEIRERDELAPLRAFLRSDLSDDSDEGLGVLSRDVIRSGPDPGVSVPVAAGIDRFASRLGLLVARPEPASIAQRAEAAAGRTIMAMGLPLLVQAGAGAILAARERLAAELEAVRRVFESAGASPDRTPEVDAAASAAARGLAEAMESCRADLARAGDVDDPRPVVSAATVALVSMPADVVLTASAAAARSLSGRGGQRREPSVAARSDRVLSLVVRVLGRSGRRPVLA